MGGGGVRSYIRSLYKEILNIEYKNCCLYVGQMIYRKGIDILLEVAKCFDGNTGFVLVGGAPTEDYLGTTNDHKLTNVKFIDFLGKQDINMYYKAADIFVLPTREDIWGLVINEAMAFGLPIITTNKCIAGLELVKDDVNGYIIPSEDVNELKRKVGFMFEDKKRLVQFGKQSRNIAEKYTIESMSAAHMEILKKYHDE